MKFVYSAIVNRVIDGDTIDASVDLGFHIYTSVRFRLNGIDTAEVTSSDPALREIAYKAKQRVSDLIVGKEVTIRSSKSDKYGRWLADVYIDALHLNDILLSEGLAKKYDGVGSTSVLW